MRYYKTLMVDPECRSGFGRTWDESASMNEAYDYGRNFGRKMLGLD